MIKINNTNIKVNVSQTSIKTTGLEYNNTIIVPDPTAYGSGYTDGFDSGNTYGYSSGYTYGYSSGYTDANVKNYSITITLNSGVNYLYFTNEETFGDWTLTNSTNISNIKVNINGMGFNTLTGFTSSIGDIVEIRGSLTNSSLTSSMVWNVKQSLTQPVAPVNSRRTKYVDDWSIQMLNSYQQINYNQLDTPEKVDYFLELLQPNFSIYSTNYNTTHTGVFRNKFSGETYCDFVKIFFTREYIGKGNQQVGYISEQSTIGGSCGILKNDGTYIMNIGGWTSYPFQSQEFIDSGSTDKTSIKPVLYCSNISSPANMRNNLTYTCFSIYAGQKWDGKMPHFSVLAGASVGGNFNQCWGTFDNITSTTSRFENYPYFTGIKIPGGRFKFDAMYHNWEGGQLAYILNTNLNFVEFINFSWTTLLQTNVNRYLNYNNFGYEWYNYFLTNFLNYLTNYKDEVKFYTSSFSNTAFNHYWQSGGTLYVANYVKGYNQIPQMLSYILENNVPSGQTRTYTLNFDCAFTGETIKCSIKSGNNGTLLSNQVSLVQGHNTIVLTTTTQTTQRNHIIVFEYDTSSSCLGQFEIKNFSLSPAPVNKNIRQNATFDLRYNREKLSIYPDLVSKISQIQAIWATYGYTCSFLYD